MSGYTSVPIEEPSAFLLQSHGQGHDEEQPPEGAPTFSVKPRSYDFLQDPIYKPWLVILGPIVIVMFIFVLARNFGGQSTSRKILHEIHELKEEMEDMVKEMKILRKLVEKGL
ncbi:hypothetical protein M231_00173 [Tremella mesenterica]|uniref:Uncharacterized protein n=1 Tax=Tremella mesenterica TaxID=5217 RepID=A0A4Q1BWR2_TREME|nr:uncharacterized protein TREMEDRAFT_59078 [Tremella mesenterica DSM 1558]EIW72917.1 hypothetical protein TREMEDRAFT_59078 [Tremella mesenterica DSM 1558]RXK42619.1 hypothetical protein M231_00173 [Tremella mesenterica]